MHCRPNKQWLLINLCTSLLKFYGNLCLYLTIVHSYCNFRLLTNRKMMTIQLLLTKILTLCRFLRLIAHPYDKQVLSSTLQCASLLGRSGGGKLDICWLSKCVNRWLHICVCLKLQLKGSTNTRTQCSFKCW